VYNNCRCSGTALGLAHRHGGGDDDDGRQHMDCECDDDSREHDREEYHKDGHEEKAGLDDGMGDMENKDGMEGMEGMDKDEMMEHMERRKEGHRRCCEQKK